MTNLVEIKNLKYIYDQRKTDGINDLNLTITKGEVFTLIGPSGSGKSTTLKCIANILKAKSGEINFIEEVKIAYVDQFPNLEDSLTVYENLDSVLKEQIEDSEKRANQIRTTLAQLEITNEINSVVQDISGGQRQRVIMAQALVKNPTLLLLDEPFANLDKTLREQLLNELLELLKEKGITIIWVTHNTEEALAFSDTIALLNFGKVQQVDSPQSIYYRPKNMFAAQYFSEVNLVPAKLKTYSKNEITVNFFNKDFILNTPKGFSEKNNNDVLVIIHPEHIVLDNESKDKGKISRKIFKGSKTLIEFTHKGHHLYAEISSIDVPANNNFPFTILSEKLYCLDEV